MQLVAQHNKSIEDPDSLLIDLVDGVLSLAAKYTFERGVRTAQIRKCIIYMCIRDPCGSIHRDRFGIPGVRDPCGSTHRDRFGILVIQPTGISVGQPTARTHRVPALNDGEYDSSPRISLATDDYRSEKEVIATRAKIQWFFVQQRTSS